MKGEQVNKSKGMESITWKHVFIVAIMAGVAIPAMLAVGLPYVGTAEAAPPAKEGFVGFYVNPDEPATRIDMFCVDGSLILRSKPEGQTAAGMAGAPMLDLGVNRKPCN